MLLKDEGQQLEKKSCYDDTIVILTDIDDDGTNRTAAKPVAYGVNVWWHTVSIIIIIISHRKLTNKNNNNKKKVTRTKRMPTKLKS